MFKRGIKEIPRLLGPVSTSAQRGTLEYQVLAKFELNEVLSLGVAVDDGRPGLGSIMPSCLKVCVGQEKASQIPSSSPHRHRKIELQGFAATADLVQFRGRRLMVDATIRLFTTSTLVEMNHDLSAYTQVILRELPQLSGPVNLDLQLYLIRGADASERYRPCHRYSQFGGRAPISSILE
ncbi:hypothetical protein C8Q74DRAFT_1222798 [Fomes fomentarius]|nr:hypothetical protein C8Q74DRAFT_1222798 [Fomes fomentarius]